MQQPFWHSIAAAPHTQFLLTGANPRSHGDDADAVRWWTCPRVVGANREGILQGISHLAAVLHPDGESELSSHTATWH